MQLNERKPTGVTFRPKGVDRASSIRRGVGRTSRACSFQKFEGVVRPEMAGRKETNLDTKVTMIKDRKKYERAMDEARNGKKEELPPVGTKKRFPNGIYEVGETISGKKKWFLISRPDAMPIGVYAPSLRL